MLVVLAIVGLVTWSMAIGFGTANQAEVIRATNQLSSTIRFAYDRARYTGRHIRVHIDFEQGSFVLQQADEAMYMPATDRNGEIKVVDENALEEKAARDLQAAERYNSSLQSKVIQNDTVFNPLDPYAMQAKTVPRRKPPLFAAFDGEGTLGSLGEPVVFPDDVKIVSVRTDADLEPIKTGFADLYFFPRGQTQLAYIQLSDSDKENHYTIIVQPLTGKVEIKDGLIDLELPEEFLEGEDDEGKTRQRRSF
jgi:general secretion pathway protein H